ncbi:hypothetical protein [Pseudaminobacter sp. NGMCC 1.201702]|uniref:hypothetical protein n=1 Tax=Pseudaminobacter sp. NGMCC 1.201702 TaxID=3391825 RepID=UPI0039EE8CC7
MERFFVAFFGTLILVAVSIGIIAAVVLGFHYFGLVGGGLLGALSLASFAGLMNYLDGPAKKEPA